MNFSLKGNFESRRGNKCVITQHYMVHTILSEMFKRNRIHVSGQEAIVTKCAVRQANNMIFFSFGFAKILEFLSVSISRNSVM